MPLKINVIFRPCFGLHEYKFNGRLYHKNNQRSKKGVDPLNYLNTPYSFAKHGGGGGGRVTICMCEVGAGGLMWVWCGPVADDPLILMYLCDK